MKITSLEAVSRQADRVDWHLHAIAAIGSRNTSAARTMPPCYQCATREERSYDVNSTFAGGLTRQGSIANSPKKVMVAMAPIAAHGLASAANRLLLRQSMPTERQLQLWDRRIIPVSRVFDALLRRSMGKSIVGVWRKPEEGAAGR